MTIGQLNIITMPTVRLPGTSEPALPAAPITGDVPSGGDFAGVLNSMQIKMSAIPVPEAGVAPPDLVGSVENQSGPDNIPEAPSAAAATLVGATPVFSAPSTDGSQPVAAAEKKSEVPFNDSPLQIELAGLASQLANAAYFQPGIMPAAGIPEPPPADRAQNIAIASTASTEATGTATAEQLVTITAQTPRNQPEHEAARQGESALPEPAAATPGVTALPASLRETPAKSGATAPEVAIAAPFLAGRLQNVARTAVAIPETVIDSPEADFPAARHADTLQNAATGAEQPDVTPASFSRNQTEYGTVQQTEAPLPAPVVKTAPHPASSLAIPQGEPVTAPEMHLTAQPAVARLQNVAAATEQPDATPASPGRNRMEHGTVQQTAATLPAPVEKAVPLPASSMAIPQGAAEKVPEVSLRAQPAGERLHNVTTATEQPDATPASPGRNQTEHGTVQQTEATLPAPVERTAPHPESSVATPKVAAVKIPEARLENQPAVVRLQNVARATEQPVVAPVSPGRDRSENVYPQHIEATPTTPAGRTAPLPESSMEVPQEAQVNTPEVKLPAQRSADRLQNVAATLEQPAANSASASRNQPEPSPPPRGSDASIIPAPNGSSVPQEAKTAAMSAQASEKTASSVALAPEQPSALPAAPAAMVASEWDLEIQLSQPRPITARTAVLSAATDSRAQGLRNSRQQGNPVQLIERPVTGTELSTVEETPPAQLSASTEGESDHSPGNGDWKDPELASGSKVSPPDMRGQLTVEHQKASATATRATPNEAVRQNAPEQIMSQVKERLAQHEVKPGNQQITLTLSPDTLGELKMNLNLQGQKLSVEIVTENRTVRDAIVQHTDALKESLARQNITMESFDVTTGGKGSGSQGQNQNAWRELAKQQQQQFWTSPRGYNTARADLPAGSPVYQEQRGNSMLDIHY